MLPPLNLTGIPQGSVNLSQYFGFWAIEENAGVSLWQMAATTNWASHIAGGTFKSEATITIASLSAFGEMLAGKSVPKSSGKSGQKAAAGDYQIAVIEIRGAMTKQGSSISQAGSMVMIRQAMRQCRMDPSIDGVMVIIDSPGGTVSGTAELGDEYALLSKAKPTLTFVEDTMASAALWVGSQGRKVFANSDHAMVGSKGVLFALYDMSGKAAQEGIRPVLIRTGDLKGAGFPGSPITADQEMSWQTMVDETNASFDRAMSVRKISASAIAELSRGGMFSAKSAVGNGLIDGVMSFDGALSELKAMIVSEGEKKGSTMTESTASAAASLPELEAACRGADSDFLMSQLRLGATAAMAGANWNAALNARMEALQAKVKGLEQTAEAHAKLTADNAATVQKLAALETENKGLKAELETANKTVASFKRQTGFRPIADTGGPNGKPTNKGKKVGTNTKKDQNDADSEDPEDDDDDEDGGGTSAKELWDNKFNALVKKGKSRESAIKFLVSSEPDLHAAMLEEANADRAVPAPR